LKTVPEDNIRCNVSHL